MTCPHPCSCGHIDPDPTFIAIQSDRGVPLLALFNCRACNSTRAIVWGKCSDEQRAAANLAELSRQGKNEMVMGRGR